MIAPANAVECCNRGINPCLKRNVFDLLDGLLKAGIKKLETKTQLQLYSSQAHLRHPLRPRTARPGNVGSLASARSAPVG